MAQPSDHIDQARENRVLAERLLANSPGENTSLQWAVTMTFYASLHALTAYLLQRGVQVSNHQHREAALADRRNSVPQPVLDAYLRLKRRSILARYDLGAFTPQQVRQLLDVPLKVVFNFAGL
jgi:hypothetical protein